MERKSGTTQRKPMTVEGQVPFAFRALILEKNKISLRKILPCVSTDVKVRVLENFYERGWRIRRIKTVLNLRYDVIEEILQAVYLEVKPPPTASVRRAA